eukprot:10534315-Lingulodinium_polyedra.AAC.1
MASTMTTTVASTLRCHRSICSLRARVVSVVRGGVAGAGRAAVQRAYPLLRWLGPHSAGRRLGWAPRVAAAYAH